jgi:hypothetical protein
LYGFDLKVKRLGYLSYRNCSWNTILEVKVKAWGYIDLMIVCDAYVGMILGYESPNR